MRIYIPSRNRATLRDFESGPLPFIPPEYRSRTAVVVREAEVPAYRTALAVHGLDWAEVVGTEAQNISLTRQACGEHARQAGEGSLLMLDDDVDILVRREPDTWRLRAAEHEDVSFMLRTMEHLLGSHASVGVSSREGNNRAGVGPAPLLVENTRLMRAWSIRTDVFLAMEHGLAGTMDDFDMQLQVLKAGYSNACMFYWANGQRMTQQAGGATDYRTHQSHHDSAVALELRHRPFVRLREKRNKTDAEGFGTRTEVTCYWKKAAAKGREWAA